MSLTSAFQIGRSALTASQLAIQVAGNNLANAATPGYTRQVAYLKPVRGDPSTLGAGRGVLVTDIRRTIDEALQKRVWSGTSDLGAAQKRYQVLSSLEASLNELTDYDLSSELGDFFNIWSEVANLTQSATVAVHRGEQLASYLRELRSELGSLRGQVDRELSASIERADALLEEIARLNGSITAAEAGSNRANALRDQRDQLITELSEYLDVTIVERESGAADVLVGSAPVVLGNQSRGLGLKRFSVHGRTDVAVMSRDSEQTLDVRSGRIGALLGARDGAINRTIDDLDGITSQLIFEVNRLHSTGTNALGLRSTTGTLAMGDLGRAAPLSDPEHPTLAGLPFSAVNGGFYVHVQQASTGTVRTVRIDVDLDGVTDSGTRGVGDDTTVEDIRAALDAVQGISASFTADGRLQINAAEGFTFSFSEDTSGVLAVLGVNSYFTGTDAGDIAVREELLDDPSLLMRGRLAADGSFIENGTALAMAQLQDRAVSALADRTIGGAWDGVVQTVGMRTEAAGTRADAAALVQEGLEAQRAAVSGVNIDEETINLMTYQRQYEGAARFISTVDELTQILLEMV